MFCVNKKAIVIVSFGNKIFYPQDLLDSHYAYNFLEKKMHPMQEMGGNHSFWY